MLIKINDKEECEIHFSWKEIWTIIKKKKLTLNENFLDRVTGHLINVKFSILEKRKEKENNKQNVK